MLAVLSARDEPIVATFHTAMTRSRAMAAGPGVLQLVLERITARIAVSALARKVQVEHLGGGALEIPNGVSVAAFATPSRCPAGPAPAARSASSGRFTEPRKGFPILLEAFAELAPTRPGLRLLVAGPGRPGRGARRRARRGRATGSRSSAWWPRRRRPGCCAASTCTSRPTPAASRSA